MVKAKEIKITELNNTLSHKNSISSANKIEGVNGGGGRGGAGGGRKNKKPPGADKPGCGSNENKDYVQDRLSVSLTVK